MSSLLETLRQTHEDLETLKHLAAAALQSRATPAAPHPRLSSVSLRTARDAEQLAADLLSHAREKARALADAHAAPAPTVHADASSAFYARLRELRDAHRAGAPPPASPADRDAALLAAASRPAVFSGEEGAGRYLDLLSHYHAYRNLLAHEKRPAASATAGATATATAPRIEYYEYVRDAVTAFDRVPAAARNARPYEAYLAALNAYLAGFARRAHPLDPVDAHIASARARVVATVEKALADIADTAPAADVLLERMGADAVKERLLAVGLKCGGRPLDRADRLLRAARNGKYGTRVVEEGVLKFMLEELLVEERDATVANVQKKLSLSYAEIEAERLAEEAIVDGNEQSDEEPESTVYNPKDVPLGWDGKPIPYWMYKLHGLNHEFKCEICGGASYKGPRAFERHFTDAQHVTGLRRLGIGYSKAFLMITGIQDALRLNEKMQEMGQKATVDEGDMEFEDAEGNVMNWRTYQDLKRQGLL